MSDINILGFYFVKSFSIFLTSIYYFISGSSMSIVLNKIIPEDTDLKNKNTLQLILEVMVIFGLIGLGFYFIRVFVKNIPNPLEGLFSFQSSRLKEATGGVIIAYIIFTYQPKLQQKLSEIKKRLNL